MKKSWRLEVAIKFAHFETKNVYLDEEFVGRKSYGDDHQRQRNECLLIYEKRRVVTMN